MANKTFQQFDNKTSANTNDFIVGYNSLEQKEKRYQLSLFATELLGDAGLSTGSHQLKKLAQTPFIYYGMAAVNTNEEVVAWGTNEYYVRWGHGWYAGDAGSHQPVIIPFFDGTPRNPGEMFQLKSRGLTIEEHYECRLHSLVRLSNGHVYLKAYAGNGHAHGWSNSLNNLPVSNPRYLSGYFRVTGFVGFNGNEVGVRKVGILPVAGWNSNAVYWAIDVNDDLHLWGNFNYSAQGGESTSLLYSPTNVTKDITALKQNVKDAQISGANHTTTILTKNRQIWHCGYNGNGQGSNGNKSTISVFTRARKYSELGDSTAGFVDDADQLFSVGHQHVNLGYISVTTGTGSSAQNRLFISGERVGGSNYYLRPNTPAAPNNDNSYAPGVTSPAGDPFVSAKIQGRHGYPTAIAITQNGRVYSAGTSSWGEGGRLNGTSVHLGSNWAQCKYQWGTQTLDFAIGQNLKAKQIITDPSNYNANATGIIAENAAGYRYLLLAGYRTLTNSGGSYPETDPQFRPLSIGYSVAEAVLGGDTTNHQWTFVRTDNNKVYAVGYSYRGLITSADKWIPVPQLTF